jgi:hypothetical protein
MAKITKRASAETSESGGEFVTTAGTARKAAAKKQRVASKKATAKKSVGKKKLVKQSSGKSTGTKKPAPSKKTAARKSVAITKAGKNSAPQAKNASAVVVSRQISSVERRLMIAEAAYLRAQSQGFLSNEEEDWLLAEAEIDSLLTRTNVLVAD